VRASIYLRTFPPPRRYMDLETFVDEAHDLEAVVFLALQGGETEDGTLQAFLEYQEVPYTGARILLSAIK
jgi:D-alanine-D-alanine ligase-like ATP-grasp enzyme